MTLEATDDLETGLAENLKRGSNFLTRFTEDVWRAIERISVLPHLARVHHGQVRVTALTGCPYRIWYILDNETRQAILIALVAVTHPGPDVEWTPQPRRTIWWSHMPYLPPLLPEPYEDDTPQSPPWQEEDDQWWQTRMGPRQP
ncbi:MAG: hypothetical protein FWF25_05050 [Propionibacteriaceae bacterium]|nr:hypothetical protein [Propionibacteriaceae bacterium]